MVMNKKEQLEMAELRKQLTEALALKHTPRVTGDVLPPSSSDGGIRHGFSFNSYTQSINVACTSSRCHSIGRETYPNTQGPLTLFSTRLLALRGLRNSMEDKFAEELAKIDATIEKESNIYLMPVTTPTVSQ